MKPVLCHFYGNVQVLCSKPLSFTGRVLYDITDISSSHTMGSTASRLKGQP